MQGHGVTDHGWGSHHLILGGDDDSGSRGAHIPTTSVDQYGATLAAWLGVPATDLASVFPNLQNFGNWNLGFMG